MNNKTKSIIAYSGIGLCVVYLVVVVAFIVTKSQLFLTGMEVVTIISAPLILLLIEAIITFTLPENKWWQHLAHVFTACCIVLTATTHFVNLTVTRPLMDKGLNVPKYFQIGQWPSIEMAADYLAWGFFLGLAFICTAVAVFHVEKLKRIRITVLVCGIMCLVGFMGPVLNLEPLWYVAIMGYTIGTILICIELMRLNNHNVN
jgi:hypothetical protein